MNGSVLGQLALFSEHLSDRQLNSLISLDADNNFSFTRALVDALYNACELGSISIPPEVLLEFRKKRATISRLLSIYPNHLKKTILVKNTTLVRSVLSLSRAVNAELSQQSLRHRAQCQTGEDNLAGQVQGVDLENSAEN